MGGNKPGGYQPPEKATLSPDVCSRYVINPAVSFAFGCDGPARGTNAVNAHMSRTSPNGGRYRIQQIAQTAENDHRQTKLPWFVGVDDDFDAREMFRGADYSYPETTPRDAEDGEVPGSDRN